MSFFTNIPFYYLFESIYIKRPLQVAFPVNFFAYFFYFRISGKKDDRNVFRRREAAHTSFFTYLAPYQIF